MTELTKTPDGLLERTQSNLSALIDRYIPLHTREEVREMQHLHEERIWDLLSIIHKFRERNHRLTERMDAMEKEFYSQVRIPVSLGVFKAEVDYCPLERTRTVAIRWAIPPHHMNYQISECELYHLTPDDTPNLFEMIGRQFEEHAKRDLLPMLRNEYAKLYSQIRN